MSKTPEEMAIDYCEPILSDDYAKAIGREDWIGTRCVKVGEGHEMYKAFLAGYKAAQPQWISVKDRLPEDGQGVLVTTGKGGGTTATYFDGDGFYNGHLEDVVITHWMPLPPATQTNLRLIEKSSQEGCKPNETRATFIVREDDLAKLKALAYWERRLVKDVMAEMIAHCLERYEAHNGEIMPMPKEEK
jgi:hypothetical protein